MSASTEILSYSGPMTGRLPSLSAGVALSLRVGVPIDVGIPIHYGPDQIYRLDALLISAELVSPGTFVARFTVDENVEFVLTLIARQVEQGATFEAGQFSLNYHISEPRPRAHFVASTLLAIFALAGGFHLRIPELEIDQKLNIGMPLAEISQLLERRQMAYRLLVIEKAAGVDILLPSAISVADKSALGFVYHAIVDRSFIWHSGSYEAPLRAREWRDLVPSTHQPFLLTRTLDSFVESVLGHSIKLGRATVTIEDAVMDRLEGGREEMTRDDGHEVKVEIESLSGQVRYDFPEAPSLPAAPWDSKIRDLINLESELDSALFASYNQLAAASLAELDEAERSEITARPEIGEAFLPDDSSAGSI